MWPRKKRRASLIASLLGAASAAAVGFRTAPVTSSACLRVIVPGGANEPMPVESLELSVESPAKTGPSALSSFSAPLSTFDALWPDTQALLESNRRLFDEPVRAPLPGPVESPAEAGPPALSTLNSQLSQLSAPGDPNAAALDDLRAAAAGHLWIDDTGAASEAPPAPPVERHSEPAPFPAAEDPAQPLAALPAPAPALPALLAAALLPVPAVFHRRARARLAIALAERVSSTLGLLLIVAWSALHRRRR
jgi:hypothetical protein